jgi:hypothetical protein
MKIKPNTRKKTKMKNLYETSAKQVRNEYKTKDEQNQKQTSMKAETNSQSKLRN